MAASNYLNDNNDGFDMPIKVGITFIGPFSQKGCKIKTWLTFEILGLL